MKITLDEKSTDNIVKYVNEHPDEIRELLETFAAQAIDVLMEGEVLEKGAELYKKLKREYVRRLKIPCLQANLEEIGF